MIGRREKERRAIVRGALLLALMIVLQSLRLLVPVPPFVSMFVIGSAVNACLLLAVMTGRAAGRVHYCLPGAGYRLFSAGLALAGLYSAGGCR